MHHQLATQFDANVKHIEWVQTIGNSIQDAHSLLLWFNGAVVILGPLECCEVLCSLNDWLDSVFLLELLPAVGHNSFNDVQTNFPGVETDCLHARDIYAELHY